MGLVAAEENATMHAKEAELKESTKQNVSSEETPSSSGETLARHLNGLKIEVNGANAAGGSLPQQPLPMGYPYSNGHFHGGSMHMVPMTLVIPPSPTDTLHLPMTLSSPLNLASPLNLDPNAREFTPSPSPSPSGVVGLPMPPPFSMGPAYDPSYMYGPMAEIGHPMYPPNGEISGHFYPPNQYSPGSNSSWEDQDAERGGYFPAQNSPPGREHVSRALLISGVDPGIDNAELAEELSQWGPVRALGLERKAEGLVVVNYFDLRHAKEALHEIQQQHLKHQKDMQEMMQQGPAAEKAKRPGSKRGKQQSSGEENPDLKNGVRGLVSGRAVWAQYTIPGGAAAGPDPHNQGTLVVFNLDMDMPAEDLRKAFESYGDVKELRETPSKRQHKFVEFFDVRAAAHALQALDGTELGGKHVKIEFSRPGGQARRAQAARGSPPNSVGPPNPAPQGGQLYGVTNMGWEGVKSGGFAAPPSAGPPIFMFLPNFPGGGMELGQAMLPGLHFQGGPFPMPPFPAMFPPHGFEDHMGRFPGFQRGPGAPDMHAFRGRPADINRKVKGFPEDDFMQAGVMRRPKDGIREGVRAQYTFNEFEAELQKENPRTTLMIKNIPNKYSQAMLLALLDAHCVRCNSKVPPSSSEPLSAYDFVYLPIDFKNRCNLGYAFVNFTSAQATLNLYKEFHAQQWEAFNSRKVCQVTYARVQGRKALEDHFRNSRFACDTDEYLPLVFNPPRDGIMCSPPIVAAGHLAGKIASCAGAVSEVAQAHGISMVDGGGLKGPRIGLVQH